MTEGSAHRALFLQEVQREFELTRRQAEVAYYVRCGLSNKRVAELLRISRNTVKAHLHEVFVNIGVHTRTELVATMDDSLNSVTAEPRNVYQLPRSPDPDPRSSSE